MIIQHVDGIAHCNAQCDSCSGSVSVAIRSKDFYRWQGGEYIQDAAPYLSVDDREFLISRICADCFDEMFGTKPHREDEDDE